MKDSLKYYYNINVIEIIKEGNNYLIYDDNNLFLLYKLEIDDITYFLRLSSSNTYKFINNCNKSYISKINGEKYILLLTKGIINNTITLNDILSFNKNNIIIKKSNIDLIKLWSKKIDYLEYQISELGKEYNEILNSFSFFIGLAENAITFIDENNINFNNIRISLSHIRIPYNEIALNFYNPINIREDYVIRDSAEYLKSKVLYTDYIINDVKMMIKKFNIDEIKLFYARLLFPSLYFDELEKILVDKKDSSNINIYIDKLNNYINLLKDTYYEIKKDISIDIPNWIIKN